MPEDVPDRMPEDLPDRMPDRMPIRMPEDMPDRVPENIPERMSEHMPERTPEDMPEDIPDRTSTRGFPISVGTTGPQPMPERAAEDILDRMPERTSNSMVRITRSKVLFSGSNTSPARISTLKVAQTAFCCGVALKCYLRKPCSVATRSNPN
jgi:hypothetical protein